MCPWSRPACSTTSLKGFSSYFIVFHGYFIALVPGTGREDHVYRAAHLALLGCPSLSER